MIRAKPGKHGGTGWHTHDLEVQLVYVLKGWVEFDHEGVGEVRIEALRKAVRELTGHMRRNGIG